MKKTLLVVTLLSVIAFVPSVFAQCSQSGSDLIVDGGFVNNCSNWQYSGGATRETSAICSTGSARVLLPQSDSSPADVYQDVTAFSSGSSFTLTYSVQQPLSYSNCGGGCGPATFGLNITDLNTNTVTYADAVGGYNAFCTSSRTVNLGTHSEWLGHTLRVEAFQDFGTFRVSNISLVQQ
jgi:hypothetical protein